MKENHKTFLQKYRIDLLSAVYKNFRRISVAKYFYILNFTAVYKRLTSLALYGKAVLCNFKTFVVRVSI